MNIIRNQLFISEDYRLNDGLIEFESETIQKNLQRIKQSAIIALVGDYGSGKSTALYNAQLADDNPNHKWLQFDAWRYPERKGLWDGLVIEIAKQLGQENTTTRKVDGNKSIIGKWGGMIGETFSQFSEYLPKAELNKIELDNEVTQKAAKLTGKAQEIFGRSPVKRIYEMERILADILMSTPETRIYLVAEDIDRSGADGLHFLETLNFFIKNNEQIKKSGKIIIVIAPIATANYVESQSSYYKCVDVAFQFTPKVKSAEKFIQNVFSDTALGGNVQPYLSNVEAFVIGLFENTSYQMNIRKLKYIIRQTQIRYEEMCDFYDSVDWRAVLIFEAMKEIKTSQNPEKTLYDKAVLGQSQINEASIFTGLLLTIHEPHESIFTYRYANRKNPEDRQLNPNTQQYKFIEYIKQHHGDTSVWIGASEDGFGRKGYIAEYYRR